ncbi:MAG: 5-oxoprolinase subunit PxpA [Pseudomonadota bacterium]
MGVACNLNADIGEGFGAYDIGDDTALLDIVQSVNVACGFHAGDPGTMKRLVSDADAKGVSIGAHPGFNDLWGFGRRRIDMAPRDLEYMVAYQIGALQAMAAYGSQKVTHVKPHGALNNMAAEDEALAMAIGRAIKTVDDSLIFVALAGSELEKAAERLDLPLAREGFADRQYEADGNLVSRKIEGSVYKDPATALTQVLRMVADGEIVARDGSTLKRKVDTVCIHGDEPSAVALGAKVRAGLEEAGIGLKTLPELALA